MTETLTAPEPKTEMVHWATTERGRQIHYTEQEVRHALTILAIQGSSQKRAADLLREEGMKITSEQLRKWRDCSFPRLYAETRRTLAPEIGEILAGNAMERAAQADEATKLYIEAAVEKIDKVSPTHLAKNAHALSNVHSQSIEKAQLLRGLPSDIKRIDINERISVLERLGVVEKKREAIDVEAVEES